MRFSCAECELFIHSLWINLWISYLRTQIGRVVVKSIIANDPGIGQRRIKVLHEFHNLHVHKGDSSQNLWITGAEMSLFALVVHNVTQH